MKSIVIASGKGGAGKTSVSAALARYLGARAVLADCDVDAANAVIALGAKELSRSDYSSGEGYTIDAARCTGCGECARACRFGAIFATGGMFRIDEALCERCGLCQDVCSFGAVIAGQKHGGYLALSGTDWGSLVSHAELVPGEDTSGKLVRQVRLQADAQARKSGGDFVLIDAPPGIGCPVIASLSGVKLAVVVMEAGRSGMSDAVRLFSLLSDMKIPSLVVLNKTGLDTDMDKMARETARAAGAPVVAELPYDARLRASTEAGEAWVDAVDPWVREQAQNFCKAIIEYTRSLP